MQIRDHRVVAARRRDSANCDDRPAGSGLSLIVIHNISLPRGHFGGDYIEQLFCNELDTGTHPDFLDLARLTVSAHLLVRRSGEVIQFVPFDRRAWHAGESAFAGVAACNDYAIGIELEGTDDSPYNPRQYEVLAAICSALIAHYPELTEERIVGHCDVAPGRKSDPGPAFSWDRFHRLLRDTRP